MEKYQKGRETFLLQILNNFYTSDKIQNRKAQISSRIVET